MIQRKTNKTKRIIVRITEDQLRKLTDQLIKEETNRSEYLRKVIQEKLKWFLKIKLPSNLQEVSAGYIQ